MDPSDPVSMLRDLTGLDKGIQRLSENPEVRSAHIKDINVTLLQVQEIIAIIEQSTFAPSHGMRSFLTACIDYYQDLRQVLNSVETPSMSARVRSKLRRAVGMRNETVHLAIRSFRRSVLALLQVAMQDREIQNQREWFDIILEALAQAIPDAKPQAKRDSLQDVTGVIPPVRQSVETLSTIQRRLSTIMPVAGSLSPKLEPQLPGVSDPTSAELLPRQDSDLRQQTRGPIFTGQFIFTAAIYVDDRPGRVRSEGVRMRWDSQSEINFISQRIIDRYDLGPKTKDVDETLKGLKGMVTKCTRTIELRWYEDRSPVTHTYKFYVMEDEKDFEFDIILNDQYGLDNLHITRKDGSASKRLAVVRLLRRSKTVKLEEMKRKRLTDMANQDQMLLRSRRVSMREPVQQSPSTPTASLSSLSIRQPETSSPPRPSTFSRPELSPVAERLSRDPVTATPHFALPNSETNGLSPQELELQELPLYRAAMGPMTTDSSRAVVAGPSDNNRAMSLTAGDNLSSLTSARISSTSYEDGETITTMPMSIADALTNEDGEDPTIHSSLASKEARPLRTPDYTHERKANSSGETTNDDYKLADGTNGVSHNDFASDLPNGTPRTIDDFPDVCKHELLAKADGITNGDEELVGITNGDDMVYHIGKGKQRAIAE